MHGKIDLTKLVPNWQKALKSGIVKKADECTSLAYWINLDNQSYLFKTCDSKKEIVCNLLVQKIASEEKISVVETRFATLGYYFGELSKNYRKKDCNYLMGSQILHEYYIFLQKEKRLTELPIFQIENLPEEEILDQMNNLETIWQALNFHYTALHYINKNQIVAEIMEDLVKRFCIDFLTMQKDRYNENWEIEENIQTNHATLTPLFDSNQSFSIFDFSPKMGVIDNSYTHNSTALLKNFLSFSEHDTVEYFKNLVEKNTPEKLEQDLKEILKENNIYLATEEQKEIIDSYEKHYNRIQQVLQERKEGIKYES